MEPATSIGGYEILAPLGAGGMGEVYRAHDPDLGRDVAIKVLPGELTADPERIARFEREARSLASLQHPNIASVYGFEKDGDRRFLVMELVEGRDLSEILKEGQIPLDLAVALAVQLTDGLTAAHERGIIHRDLKPANIKITPSGDLKILDFGLARAAAGDQDSEVDVHNSPTITAAMTRAGVILGTAAYMSPEQARGEAVDQRADVWAFGVILFEMLTGKQFFGGATVSDTLAAVLRAEIDWDLLPQDTPPNVRRLLRRCLTRNPKDRLRAAADARLELTEDEQPVVETTVARRSAALPVALGLLAASLILAAWIFRPTPSPQEDRLSTHLSLALPDGLQVASRDALPLGVPQPCLAISDDGRLIVVTVERDGSTWLYRRFLDQPEGELLEDTRGGYHPQVSPDGQNISFMKGDALMRIGARGGRATSLIELPNSFGQCWINNREIVVNRSEATELVRIDVERGTAEAYPSGGALERYYWPSRIPGREAILFNSREKGEAAGADEVTFMDLPSLRRNVVGINGSMPRLLPDGKLLLIRDGVLFVAAVDLDRLDEPVRPSTALEGLLVEGGIGQYAVSENGTMIYVPGGWLLGNELVWDGGRGNIEPLAFPLLSYGDFELSPDGRSLAITVGGGADSQVWIYDLERGARRLLTTDGSGASGIWAPDGERIAYGAQSGNPWGIYVRTVGSNEPATLLYESDQPIFPYAWHDDVGIMVISSGASWDIFRLDPDNPDELEPFVVTDASEWGPDISPDGKWVAYVSDESGRYEIYVRAVGSDRSFTVSLDGGEEPIFSADGQALYYRYGNRFYRTPILETSADGTRFRAGRPEVVVEGAYTNVSGLSYDVGPDGRLLLLRTEGGTERPNHLNVILNWKPELNSG